MTKETTEYIKTIRHIMALSLDTMTDEEINNCEEIIKLIKEQPRWIPCSERLPEKNGNYLVTVEANDGTASIKFQMVDHYGPDWLHEEKHEKVIAWMPLPEPYQSND